MPACIFSPRTFFCFLVFALTGLLVGCGGTVDVTTSYGVVAGRSDGQVTRFYGIPYAQPPVGDLRWADPLAPQPWDGVRDAAKMGPGCTQYGVGMPVFNADEDCLTLNIWVPNTPGPHPVMVWVHGGGQMGGASSEPQYNGRSLAVSQNVMVVSVNYRLLTSGFFALPATGSRPAISGNQAIKDLIAALQWVHAEIAPFGGDPANVTVFGESAGSTNVCALLATPKTQTPQRLLNRVILQSGACDTLGIMTLEQAQQEGLNLLQKLGCTDAAEPLDCARAAPIKTLRDLTKMNMLKSLTYRLDEWRFRIGLVIDGDVFPDNPLTLLAQDTRPDTPVLLGSNRDEGSLFAGFLDHPDDAAGYRDFLESRYPGQGDVLAALYPFENFRNAGDAHAALRGDLIMKCPTLNMARTYSVHNTTWHYYFTQDVSSLTLGTVSLLFGRNPPRLGTFHGSDIGFIFDFPLATSSYQKSDRAVKNFMRQAWGNFARTGNPNGPGLAQWEPFDAARNNYLELKYPPENRDGFRGNACDYWFETGYGF